MQASKHLISHEHAAKFDGYISKWQSLLNLHDWRITRGVKKADKGCLAQVERSYPDRLANYRLGANWGVTEPTDHELESTAAHELLHVLLCELIEQAQGKVSDDLLMAAEHRIVITLERLLVPKGD